MSTTLLLAAIGQVHNQRRDEELRHDAAVSEANRKGESPPSPDLPSAGVARWVRWAARILSDAGVNAWYPDADLRAEECNLVGLRIDQLLQGPEFEIIRNEPIEIRWSTRPMLRKDLQSTEVLLGRVKVVPDQDRLTWPRGAEPPTFRLLLSLPATILATGDELDRALHGLLSECGMSDGTPVLRRPDVVGFATTLARFGATGIRECHAIAGAMRHPDTARRMAQYGFDPSTGQGLLWAPRPSRQLDVGDVN